MIESIESISVLEGTLHERIKAYKYDGRRGWRVIFGRLLLGHLEASPHLEADLIVANPTFVGPGARQTFPHTEAVLEEAQRQDLREAWPFAPDLLRLTAEPPKSANQGYHAKKEAALARMDLLEVTDLATVRGADVIVYDDVCTTGWQLEACARVLADAGATSVRGLVLARKYWG